MDKFFSQPQVLLDSLLLDSSKDGHFWLADKNQFPNGAPHLDSRLYIYFYVCPFSLLGNYMSNLFKVTSKDTRRSKRHKHRSASIFLIKKLANFVECFKCVPNEKRLFPVSFDRFIGIFADLFFERQASNIL